jgi:hypothetical protein
MSGSNWGKGLKIRLILVAAIIGFAIAASTILWGLSQKSKYEREADGRYKEYASHSYYPNRYACLSLPIFNQIDCIAKHEADAREYQRSEQDLVSQRVTALWTVLMGGAAIIGMMLSAVGIILVWTTFRETREANIIANDTIEHEKFNSRKQLRAYVSATPNFVCCFSATDKIEVRFEMINSGSTFASRVRHGGRVEVFSFPFDDSLILPPLTENRTHETTVFPRQTFTGNIICDRTFSQDVIDGICEGRIGIIAWGVIEYEDVFEEPHYTKFSSHIVAGRDVFVHLTSNYIGTDLKISFAAIGQHNEAT